MAIFRPEFTWPLGANWKRVLGSMHAETIAQRIPASLRAATARCRAAQKRRFLGEFFPAQWPEGVTGRAFAEFFQVNKLAGEAKGILAIRLKRVRQR